MTTRIGIIGSGATKINTEYMEKLIEKYKSKIAELQQKQKRYTNLNMSGACISLQGEIQAYNAVIKDLQNLSPGTQEKRT